MIDLACPSCQDELCIVGQTVFGNVVAECAVCGGIYLVAVSYFPFEGDIVEIATVELN